jgi:hypothetical protein
MSCLAFFDEPVEFEDASSAIVMVFIENSG